MGTTRVKVVDLSQEEEKKTKKASPKVAAKPSDVIANGSEAISQKSGNNEEISTSNQDSNRNDKGGEQEESQAPEKKTKISKPKKAPVQKHVRSKKYKEVVTLVDKTANYPTKEAFEMLRKVSFSKFDSTVELHINVVDKNIRGKVAFPFAVAKKTKEKKYLIFSEKKEAISDKQIIWATEKTIEEIEKGTIKPGKNFDVVITSAKFMPQLARIAKVLGPRGMMPNPKNGTITEDPTKLLSGSTDDAYEYRCDPQGAVLHTKIGKLSQKDEELSENLKALIKSVGPTKIKSAILKSTMSPAIKIDVAHI